MNTSQRPEDRLIDAPVSTRAKLSALWVSTMFCYVYGDYFELYVPGKLASMLAGRMEPLGPTTPTVLLGTSVMMAVPAAMVVLTLVLRPTASRWTNVVAGAMYSIVMLLAIRSGWSFYVLMGIIEIVLTASIVAVAWKWPKRAGV